MQYVKYTKLINIANAKTNLFVKNVFAFFLQIQKKQYQQNKKANLKVLCRAGTKTRDLSHPSLECYLWATKTTEYIHWIQAI